MSIETKSINIEDKASCYGCGACIVVCPKSCIELVRDDEGFDYPSIRELDCIKCGKCVSVCPFYKKTDFLNYYEKPFAYAAWNVDEDIRYDSTSGGVFSALAEYVFSKGGIVFGAAFENNFQQVRHICAENINDMVKLRGSKYVQSNTIHSFRQVQNELKKDRLVLFSGTPCQVAGLHNLVGNNQNLITCDVVCHGVSSPGVFKIYIEEQCQIYNSQIHSLKFRDKRYGWNLSVISQYFTNGKLYKKMPWADRFLSGYYQGIYMRRSCYKCRFARIPRSSDITLADCWGVNKNSDLKDNNKGVSLVLINTNLGNELYQSCKGMIKSENYNLESAIIKNPQLKTPAKMPLNRNVFFDLLKTNTFRTASALFFSKRTLIKRYLIRIVKQTLGIIHS